MAGELLAYVPESTLRAGNVGEGQLVGQNRSLRRVDFDIRLYEFYRLAACGGVLAQNIYHFKRALRGLR